MINLSLCKTDSIKIEIVPEEEPLSEDEMVSQTVSDIKIENTICESPLVDIQQLHSFKDCKSNKLGFASSSVFQLKVDQDIEKLNVVTTAFNHTDSVDETLELEKIKYTNGQSRKL